MPKRDQVTHGSMFQSRFEELDRGPLGALQLERLYTSIDWPLGTIHKYTGRTYQSFTTLSLVKALALPYLIEIPTERALARNLGENQSLQALCGFLPGQTPTRATFWHFRDKYADVYSALMIEILIALVLGGEGHNLWLPFVTPVSQAAKNPPGEPLAFVLAPKGYTIQAWKSTRGTDADSADSIETAGKTFVEIGHSLKAYEAGQKSRGQKKTMNVHLELPAEVDATLRDGQTLGFRIEAPEWLGSLTGQADTLTRVRPSRATQYTSCNVLVIREHGGLQEILLCRRLDGYGTGTYSLPGGKVNDDEFIRECAKRELSEETGLDLKSSRPVSIYRTNLPGKPRVISLGALAEEYSGTPRREEPRKGAEWQWFDLRRLPEPLFEPTRIAIVQYLNQTYPNLQWCDLEDVPESRPIVHRSRWTELMPAESTVTSPARPGGRRRYGTTET